MFSRSLSALSPLKPPFYYGPAFPVNNPKTFCLILLAIFIKLICTNLTHMKNLILVVEDNAPILENTAELLELNNYKVIIARNGNEALNLALQQLPDLILTDIRMPVMDGYHLLETVKHDPVLCKSRFIFFSASAEKKEIAKGMDLGADDYIVKPFSGEEILSKVKEYIG